MIIAPVIGAKIAKISVQYKQLFRCNEHSNIILVITTSRNVITSICLINEKHSNSAGYRDLTF